MARPTPGSTLGWPATAGAGGVSGQLGRKADLCDLRSMVAGRAIARGSLWEPLAPRGPECDRRTRACPQLPVGNRNRHARA